MIWSLVRAAVNYLISKIESKDATAKAYLSPIPVGTHLGGHDIKNIQDSFLVIDIRAAGRIILLGFFQFS